MPIIRNTPARPDKSRVKSSRPRKFWNRCLIGQEFERLLFNHFVSSSRLSGMKGVPILIAVALLVASTSYAQQQQQQNGQLPNGAPPSESPIEPRPRGVPPGGRRARTAPHDVAVAVPVVAPPPTGVTNQSWVVSTTT